MDGCNFFSFLEYIMFIKIQSWIKYILSESDAFHAFMNICIYELNFTREYVLKICGDWTIRVEDAKESLQATPGAVEGTKDHITQNILRKKDNLILLI